MMEQYHAIKATLPKEALLLFRLGDFYEMFLEDANRGARLLRVSLTKRGDMPMCGIPHHAAATYISRLLKAGCKVAICDQVEEARPGKLVKREVTRILSPGAHFDERMLLAELNNFLGSITQKGKVWGLAVADLTTGEFLSWSVWVWLNWFFPKERRKQRRPLAISDCRARRTITGLSLVRRLRKP